MDLSPAQSLKLAAILEQARISIDGLKPISPWAIDTPRAERIREAVQTADPAFAAELANGATTPSLAYTALKARAETEDISIDSLPPALREEVLLRDHAMLQQQAQQREQQALQAMNDQLAEIEKARRQPDPAEQARTQALLQASRQSTQQRLQQENAGAFRSALGIG